MFSFIYTVPSYPRTLFTESTLYNIIYSPNPKRWYCGITLRGSWTRLDVIFVLIFSFKTTASFFQQTLVSLSIAQTEILYSVRFYVSKISPTVWLHVFITASVVSVSLNRILSKYINIAVILSLCVKLVFNLLMFLCVCVRACRLFLGL